MIPLYFIIIRTGNDGLDGVDDSHRGVAKCNVSSKIHDRNLRIQLQTGGKCAMSLTATDAGVFVRE